MRRAGDRAQPPAASHPTCGLLCLFCTGADGSPGGAGAHCLHAHGRRGACASLSLLPAALLNRGAGGARGGRRPPSLRAAPSKRASLLLWPPSLSPHRRPAKSSTGSTAARWACTSLPSSTAAASQRRALAGCRGELGRQAGGAACCVRARLGDVCFALRSPALTLALPPHAHSQVMRNWPSHNVQVRPRPMKGGGSSLGQLERCPPSLRARQRPTTHRRRPLPALSPASTCLQIIVVTDGSRILGLGDLGTNGGRPAGWLAPRGRAVPSPAAPAR